MRASILAILCFPGTIVAQIAINGPMPGHIDLTEATIWLQCQGLCSEQIEFWPTSDRSKARTTEPITSDPRRGHCMDIVLPDLLPGTEYTYRLIGSAGSGTDEQLFSFRTQPIWKFRTDPPEFTMAMGSCAYINEPAFDRPGNPYGGGYGIFDAIADKKPDLMLWLGDNIYLREPDWGSRSGYLHRYTSTRSTPELQRLLQSTKHYAIWDDHDFGPNDADGSFVNSALAREMFDLFWPNPTNGVPSVEGITTAFSHADVDFFLIDDRTFRIPGDMKTATPQLFGKAQLDWLVQALKYSDAPFKLVAVGSQVLNTGAVYENFSTMPAERTELLRRIEEEGVTGVVFLTGDRHYTELSSLELRDGRAIYDLTVSPLTSGSYSPKETNTLRVEGTVVDQRNFGTLTFSGKQGERLMTIRIFTADGELVWERGIPQEEQD
ncbi:MAG: alkaline phosphatase D family protein [Flavobacteriales bacterium]|nr:alkaline phosphatase D family protein [Flavobacteriales bacterium]